MSVSQWVNKGLGIELGAIVKCLDAEKLHRLLCAHADNPFEDDPEWENANNGSRLDMLGDPGLDVVDGICGIIKLADVQDMLLTGNNNEGEYYLFYSPHYGWEKNGGFPSEEAARAYIISVLEKAVIDGTDRDRLAACIDYIETYAEG